MSHTLLSLNVLKTIPVIAVSSLVVCAALVTRRAVRVINQRTIVNNSVRDVQEPTRLLSRSQEQRKSVSYTNRRTQVKNREKAYLARKEESTRRREGNALAAHTVQAIHYYKLIVTGSREEDYVQRQSTRGL
jgi:hypothetical protein